METKSVTDKVLHKAEYIIDVEKNVARNRLDVYMIISDSERRHILSIKQFGRSNGFKFLLRQTKNKELGALIDVCGLEYFNKVRVAIYDKIIFRCIVKGKYSFEAERKLQSDNQVEIFNISLSLLE